MLLEEIPPSKCLSDIACWSLKRQAVHQPHKTRLLTTACVCMCKHMYMYYVCVSTCVLRRHSNKVHLKLSYYSDWIKLQPREQTQCHVTVQATRCLSWVFPCESCTTLDANFMYQGVYIIVLACKATHYPWHGNEGMSTKIHKMGER